ncbi:DUF6221 family protein [Micromonospora sp. NPDC020750]|uniref:DUF6221 family protein n=1 Tax=unclassified Micromonospora TaxID=2617518 RepID=UPI00379A4B80
MNDLVTWLRAQLDDEEATARELLYRAQQTSLTLKDPKLLGRYIPDWHDWPDVETMCRQRIAELAASGRLLKQFELRGNSVRATVQPSTGGVWDDLLRMLALPYADRPGYRSEWKP